MCDNLIWEDNFDDYEIGEIDSQTNDWEGWGNNPSNVYVNQYGSINVGIADDLVHELGDLKYGEGYISMYLLIPNNTGTYFNFLHNYTSDLTDNDWAHEVFFAPKTSTESSYLEINEQQIEFNVVYDRYIQIKQYFDFENNISAFYYNGNLIHYWNMNETLDTPGDVKIDAINLFGTCYGSGCYSFGEFDDFMMCGNLSSQEIFGCLDTDGCNYNYLAHTDDGTCTYPLEDYLNCEGYCITDIDDDGVCDELEIFGCTDDIACNFDLSATEEDATSIYPQRYYNCLSECLNDTDSDGVCDELEIFGCTDFSACNFNIEATEDNANCIFPIEYYDCNSNCNNDSDNDGICDELEIIGCTDPLACNYEIEATDISSLACNYLTFDLIFYENSFVISSTDTINSPIYTWYFNGELINNVSSNSHVPEENGEYELIIFDVENSCEATNTVEVYGIGLSENFISDLKIHPNPATNFIEIEMKSANSEKVMISIYDLSSQLIISDIGFEVSNHLSTKRINTTDLASGEYIVKIETSVGSVIQKIIISK